MERNLFRTEDLVSKVAEVGNMTKIDARNSVNAVFDSIKELVKDETHDGVAVTGFITFEVKERDERERRNPRTGEMIHKKAETYLTAKLSKKAKKLDF